MSITVLLEQAEAKLVMRILQEKIKLTWKYDKYKVLSVHKPDSVLLIKRYCTNSEDVAVIDPSDNENDRK